MPIFAKKYFIKFTFPSINVTIKFITFIKGDSQMENKVLAVVDGRNVTETDLNFLVQSMGQNAAHFQGEAGRKQLIEELIMQELLYSDALDKNYDKDAEFIQAVEHMQKTLLKQFALNKLLSTIEVTDEEAAAYFNTHKDMFKAPETARASHILVPTLEEAEKIAEEIKGGLDFAEAATRYSTCPSSAKGGDLGEFSRGRMVPEFENAAFEMDVDSVSAPVQTQFGYHLIKLISKNETEIPEFEAVKVNVKQQLGGIKQGEVYTSTQEALKGKYDVKVMA